MTMLKIDKFSGARMREARIMTNTKLDDLVEDTGIDKKTLWCFEKGKLTPNKEQEKIIAKALEVEPVFFYWVDTCPPTDDDFTFSPKMKRM